MALSSALETHIDNLTAAAASAVKLNTADTQVVKDRPSNNVTDAVVEAVKAQALLENWSDLPV